MQLHSRLMMKKVFILLSLLWAMVTYAQQKDTIQLINYGGTLLPVINNEVLTMRDMKPLFKTHPETYAAWKKARNSARLTATFLALNVIGTFGILLSETDRELLIFLGISVTSIAGVYLNEPAKNKRLKHAVTLYNERIRSENVTNALNQPRP